jgi:hypothetical protein
VAVEKIRSTGFATAQRLGTVPIPRSTVYSSHLLLGVPLAGGRPFGHHFLDAPQVLVGECDVRSGGVLLEVFAALGAGDGDDVLTLVQ